MSHDSITVRKLSPIIGAEIGGVDLSRPLDRRVFEEVHQALMESLVIFFHDQNLSQEQHKAPGRQFGELHIHPASPPLPGHSDAVPAARDPRR